MHGNSVYFAHNRFVLSLWLTTKVNHQKRNTSHLWTFLTSNQHNKLTGDTGSQYKPVIKTSQLRHLMPDNQDTSINQLANTTN